MLEATGRRVGLAGVTLAFVLGVPPAAGQEAEPAVVGERITVVARAVSFDVLDARGRPVDGVTAADLLLLEDGIERSILEVRRLPAGTGPGAAARDGGGPEVVAEPARPGPLPKGVLVALDPALLDRFAWRESIRTLARAAESLVAMGPVEVLPVGTPGWAGEDCGQDAEKLRAVLERIGAEVAPLDLFYRNRERFLRDARRMQSSEFGGVQLPGSRMREDVLAWFESATRELAGVETAMLEDAQQRLAVPISAKPRPLVVVWVAGGDPALGDFVRQFFDDSADELSDAFRITAVAAGAAIGARRELERRWQGWAADGVQVISWAPDRPLMPDLAAASFRRPSRTRLERLATDPIGLFEDAARATGGARVRSSAELPSVLESVRGRWVLVYQTDRDEPGWRRLDVRPRDSRWTIRAPRSLPVFASGDERPPELPVALSVERAPAAVPGNETVRLVTRIGVAGLLDRFPAETPLALDLELSLTLASGRRVSRTARVALESIPLTGSILHTLELELPTGAGELRVEVREETTGARGASDSGAPTG